ncbi:VOC family protein [Paracoccus sp. (in: a-proteobacteria)]|uniref:VOC family protein n=1 Tax=Paracoccus sp. TaxID=267 RepID=UPI0028ADC5FF|nr:VOC family protein [Paracoccus sp. (in: a-proteobacteria)]
MYHGKPCWFELSAAKDGLDKADAFYGKVFGWTTADSGMEGFTYHLASHGGEMIAGLMEMPDDCADVPPFWMVYFDVDDADATAAKIGTLGGKVFREPADIPGTGRFAVVSDPQGAAFGILQPAPMDPQPPVEAGAWNQGKESHGNWIELMSTDPGAAFDFYAELFGWTKSTAMDMGEMGTYQLFSWRGGDIGGMMGLGNAPVPCWLPYFGVNGIDAAIARIRDGGGEVLHGPMEVPGSAFIAVARDPQGAHFAIVGPKDETP